MNTSYKITQAEARKTLAEVGYQLKSLDGEFEVYPKGQRGEKSYFTNDLIDAINSARFSRKHEFAESIKDVPTTKEVKAALVEWFAYHHAEWKTALYTAWINGNYGGRFANTDVASILQAFRNTNGHEVLNKI